MIPQTKHKHIHTIRKVYDPKWNRTILAGFIFIIIVRVDAAWLNLRSTLHVGESACIYRTVRLFFLCYIFMNARARYKIWYDDIEHKAKHWSGRKKWSKKKRRKKVIVEGHAFFKRNEILRLYPSIFLCLSSIWKQR